MTNNKKILSTLAITLLLSACGSSSSDKEADKTAKTDATTAQVEKESSTEQDGATKLVATPTNIKEQLKGHDMKEPKNEFSGWHRGRVQFLNMEGGFYGIITDSGKKILPMNMNREFAKNGAIVRIKGKVKNVMTIQQWGTPFTITDIELITPGSDILEEDK